MTFLRLTLGLTIVVTTSAEFQFARGCSSDRDYSDPFVTTQEGYYLLSSLGEMFLIGSSSTGSEDLMYSCPKLEFFTQGMNISIKYTGVSADGQDVTFEALGTLSNNNNRIEATAVDGVEPFPENVLNAKANGALVLHVSFLSETELVLRSCRGAFLGSYHAAYILTKQPEALMTLSDECISDTAKTFPGNTRYTFSMFWDNMENC